MSYKKRLYSLDEAVKERNRLSEKLDTEKERSAYLLQSLKATQGLALELQVKVNRLEGLLLTIQAWNIKKHQLRGHECLAKQWICSFQDQIARYKKGKK